jgi:hypothetical protein
MMHLAPKRAQWLRWTVCARRFARASVACAALVVSVLVTQHAVSAIDAPGIPPGQEQLLAAMLGRGAPLPGACTFRGGQVDHAVIRATYWCPSGLVVIALAHPSAAPASALQTANFAIALQSGRPPAALADALVSLIRSREAAFQWTFPPDEGQDS